MSRKCSQSCLTPGRTGSKRKNSCNQPACKDGCKMEVPSPPPECCDCDLEEELRYLQCKFCDLASTIDAWDHDNGRLEQEIEEKRCCYEKKVDEIIDEIGTWRYAIEQQHGLLVRLGLKTTINEKLGTVQAISNTKNLR